MTRRRPSYWIPVAAPIALALFALATDRRGAAVVFVALATALGVLLLAGVDIGARLERVATWIGAAIFTTATSILFAVVILPASLLTRLRRRDRPPRIAHGWNSPASAGNARSPGGSEAHDDRSSIGFAGRVAWGVGVVALVLAGNYGIGWAWDVSVGRSGPESAVTAIPGVDRTARPRDPRNDSPAMADSPWRARYFDDLQRTPGTYWPYTEYRPLSFSSPYINIGDWSRRTYEGYPADAEVPTVWMFGGSTTFGEGQRDEYTIASWLARQGEQEGLPVRVVNYGQRGWTHFQEMVLFEQELARQPAPDLVFFYDGVNEINTQSLVDGPIPTHYQVERYTRDLTGSVLATQFRSADTGPTDPLGDAWYAYSEHSAAHKLLRLLQSEPAGAAPLDEPGGDSPDPQTFTITTQYGIDAAEVYERSQHLSMAVAERRDVPAVYFWQAFQILGPVELLARAELRPPTIDLSESLLDHQNVFIDGAHTNEEGARIVAERIWQNLGPTIESWYEEN